MVNKLKLIVIDTLTLGKCICRPHCTAKIFSQLLRHACHIKLRLVYKHLKIFKLFEYSANTYNFEIAPDTFCCVEKFFRNTIFVACKISQKIFLLLFNYLQSILRLSKLLAILLKNSWKLRQFILIILINYFNLI